MSDYLATYGAISQQVSEAVDQMASIRAKVKGRCRGPSRELQTEVRTLYEREVLERLKVIGHLIIELGDQRPKRFAKALGHLSHNLGEGADQLVELLYLPGYRNLLKVSLALIDHLSRSLVFFQRTVTNRQETSQFNVNYLLRDIALAACPFRTDFMPPSDSRLVRISFVEKYDEEIPLLPGDGEGLYLALFQIVSNAVTAAAGQRTVSLYSRYFERFRQLQVTVADNGEGIDRDGVLRSALLTEVLKPELAGEIRSDERDQNNRVFELMFLPRVSAFAFTDQSHRGLGLTLAQEEIARHRGRIEVHSKPGRGTSFQVVFHI
jgi:signal transduction histidine kinase